MGDGESCLRGLFVAVGLVRPAPCGSGSESARFLTQPHFGGGSIRSRFLVPPHATDSSNSPLRYRCFGGSLARSSARVDDGGSFGFYQLSWRLEETPRNRWLRQLASWKFMRVGRPLLWRRFDRIMRSDRATGERLLRSLAQISASVVGFGVRLVSIWWYFGTPV